MLFIRVCISGVHTPVVFWRTSRRMGYRSPGPDHVLDGSPLSGCQDRICSPPTPSEHCHCPSPGLSALYTQKPRAIKYTDKGSVRKVKRLIMHTAETKSLLINSSQKTGNCETLEMSLSWSFYSQFNSSVASLKHWTLQNPLQSSDSRWDVSMLIKHVRSFPFTWRGIPGRFSQRNRKRYL